MASNSSSYCWGSNVYGELGADIYSIFSSNPISVSQGSMPSSVIKKISAGYGHTCAIAIDDKVYCWGGNFFGQLGNGLDIDSYTPVVAQQGAMPSNTIKQISAGSAHTCAIASDDWIYCWGSNEYGSLGDNSYSNSTVPVAVLRGAMPLGAVKSISSSGEHSCAIASDDKVYCWGRGANNQLGDGGTYSDSPVPVAVSEGSMTVGTVKQVRVSLQHSCAIASDNKAYCWGAGFSGSLGNNPPTGGSSPVSVYKGSMAVGTIKQISLGNNYTCSIDSEDKVYCWGDNYYGQLGIGSESSSNFATKITQGQMPSGAVKSIATSFRGHSCAIASDDKLYCWGDNTYGQLGIAQRRLIDTSIPVASVEP